MTEATLKSLAETVDWSKHRLIVVDNASCVLTRGLYRYSDHSMSFEVIYNDENLGTAAAINRAWKLRDSGEHAVKLDNDVVIHQAGWADLLEEVFERDPTIGICGLKRKDLAEHPGAEGDMKSTLRMLPHELGQRWLVVEDVRGVMGTCQAYNSALLDRIGYLVQPSLYGFDDSLSSIRARLAGFGRCFLVGIEIDHIDPGGDAYCQWKMDEAGRQFPMFNTQVLKYEAGLEDIHYDGGFS